MRYEDYVDAEDGTRIWYAWSEHPSESESLPLILCDGIGCDGFIWPYLIDHFRDERPIVRWHYRGHGRSDAPGDLSRLSLQDLSADLKTVLDALNIERGVLAGHSMGVQVILESWRHFPERIAGFVPICGAFERPADTFHGTDLYRPAFEQAIKVVKSAPRISSLLWKRLAPTRLALLIARYTEINRHLVRTADFMPYLEHIGHMDADLFFRMLEFAIDHSARDALPTIDAPTLIVAGDQDKFTPVDCSIEMHELIPDSELLILEGGTHTAPIELPDELEERLEPFLAVVSAHESKRTAEPATRVPA